MFVRSSPATPPDLVRRPRADLCPPLDIVPPRAPSSGYAPKYRAVENAIKAKYPKTEASGAPTPTTSGAFEVTVDGELVHSKLNGDGHVDSPDKLEKILAAIGAKE